MAKSNLRGRVVSGDRFSLSENIIPAQSKLQLQYSPGAQVRAAPALSTEKVLQCYSSSISGWDPGCSVNTEIKSTSFPKSTHSSDHLLWPHLCRSHLVFISFLMFSLSWLTNILTFVIVIRTGRENVSRGAAALWDGDLLNLGEILRGLRVERSGGCIGRTQADGNICCSILIADLISCKKGKGNTIT